MADENDDLLKPDKIEALLNSVGGGGTPADVPASNPPTSAPPASVAPADTAAGDLLGADDIEALFQNRGEGPSSGASPATTTTDQLLDQAQAGLAAAMAPGVQTQPNIPADLGSAQPFEFRAFDSHGGSATDGIDLSALNDVELDVRIELGRTELLMEEVLMLKEGAVVPLDKLAGDPVDILVNGRLIARGEVLVLNDNFCVRIAELLSPD